MNAPAKPFTVPWTVKLYDSLPGTPVGVGVFFALVLLVLFFAGGLLGENANNPRPDELRVAITHILITAYSASAYAYLLISARRATQDLSPIARALPNWQTFSDRIGKHPWWILPLVGAASFLLIGVTSTNLTTPEPVNPWHWQDWSYEVFWHRITTVLFAWWIGCFCYVLVVESARLSRLSGEIESLDLLNLQPYQPLVRQGLTNALLVIGTVSFLSLLAVESRYLPVLVGFWIAFIVLAWMGLMLPLRGIRRRVKAAKAEELDWCRQSMRDGRDALKSGDSEAKSLAEIVAYKTVIENIRNWPFESSTLVRFTLYLLIPLGSWVGGAFVERALDMFLS
jgi:hypothetical protein